MTQAEQPKPGEKTGAGDQSGATEKSGQVEPLRRPRPCPQCGKPSSRNAYPFCSRRCADIDLGHWLKQDYAIPSGEPGIPGGGAGDGEPGDGG